MRTLFRGLYYHSLNIPCRTKHYRAKVTNFLKSDKNFAWWIISHDEKYARINFTLWDNHNLSKWLVSFLGSLVLLLEALLHYWENILATWKGRILYLVMKILLDDASHGISFFGIQIGITNTLDTSICVLHTIVTQLNNWATSIVSLNKDH